MFVHKQPLTPQIISWLQIIINFGPWWWSSGFGIQLEADKPQVRFLLPLVSLIRIYSSKMLVALRVLRKR